MGTPSPARWSGQVSRRPARPPDLNVASDGAPACHPPTPSPSDSHWWRLVPRCPESCVLRRPVTGLAVRPGTHMLPGHGVNSRDRSAFDGPGQTNRASAGRQGTQGSPCRAAAWRPCRPRPGLLRGWMGVDTDCFGSRTHGPPVDFRKPCVRRVPSSCCAVTAGTDASGRTRPGRGSVPFLTVGC